MAPPIGIPMALGIASAGASIAGGYIQGKDAESQAQAQAQAAIYNAQQLEQQATQTRQKADADMRLSRLQSLQHLGTERALYGASGVDLSTGSPLDVLASDASTAEADALAIQRQGETTASRYEQQASLERQQAQNALTLGRKKASSSTVLGLLDAPKNFLRSIF